MSEDDVISFRFGVGRYWKHLFLLNSWKRLLSHILTYVTRKRLARRIAARKRELSDYKYSNAPRVAAIVQFFNKSYNIDMLYRGVIRGGFDEVVILEDGSVDGSIDKWIDRLRQPNHFIIRSNDLYEIITYNRALNFSRAEIVCLLQDDDELPKDDKWVQEALGYFADDPSLLILGGHVAVDILPRQSVSGDDPMNWVFEGDVEEIKGVFRQRHVHLAEGERFKYVQSVVRSPVFIRRQAFLDIGGFDLDYAPFLCDDMDNCLRAWARGYRVGIYRVNVARDIGLGGMRAFNSERLNKQVRINWNKLYDKHGQWIAGPELGSKIKQANDSLTASSRA